MFLETPTEPRIEEVPTQGIAKLTVGMISYWNLLPFYQELQAAAQGELAFVEGVPVQINQLLRDEAIALAPCSSVCLATEPSHEIALPLGVASLGTVKSVYLGFYPHHAPLLRALHERNNVLCDIFRKALKTSGDLRYVVEKSWSQLLDASLPLTLLPSVQLSKSSATSVMLAKLLYFFWFGPKALSLFANYVANPISEKPVELVIGNEALLKRRQFYRIIDLGQLWRELTGLPFVFAVWQSKNKVAGEVRELFHSVAEKAEQTMKVQPAKYLNLANLSDMTQKIDLAAYWKLIHYRLGPQELRGLLLFLICVRKLRACSSSDDVLVKILRWQQKMSNGDFSLSSR